MSDQNSSVILELEAGTHWICSCGQSQNFPFCDGSHQGSQFQPLALELETTKVVEFAN